jgi:glycosyltransferase involved in cell wall biosynthesis
MLMLGQLKDFKERGYETYLLAPDHERTRAFCEKEGCELLPVPIERDISPLQDLKALGIIIQHFRRIKPDIINIGTPKMGLLGTIAGRITGVKKIIYTNRGFRFEHEEGRKKQVLLAMEKLAAIAAHRVLCISKSVQDVGIANKIFDNKKSIVINKGSSNGVNLEFFDPNLVPEKETSELKKQLELSDYFVFGYVGRLIDRKGVKEVYEAFTKLRQTNSGIKLIFVGPVEEEQILDKSLLEKLHNHPDILMMGRQFNVPLYMSIMDVFVMPAWWEGFGNTLIQAAAMGLPVISSTGTGCRDAVNDGYNGILVPPKEVDALMQAMEKLLADDDHRKELGKNGIKWAHNFDSKIIWDEMNKLYADVI